MYQIDNASAVSELPAPSAAGAAGYFSDGDAVGGVAATILPAEFMNTIMLEMLGVLTAGGLAPDKTNNAQLLAALKALFQITGNLATNGHIAIPILNQKLIINWGNSSTTDASGLKTVAFDQGYETGVLAGFACNTGTGVPTAFHNTGAKTLTTMDVHCATSSGVASGSGTAFSWLTLGI